jgi:hypothetical protein
MSQVLPPSQDTELPSTNPEGEADLNPKTAPCVGTEESVGAGAILEATSVESSMPATQAVSGMPPPEDDASGTGEEGRINGDGGDAIDVDVNEDENENEDEDESGSSEVSDGGDLKVC